MALTAETYSLTFLKVRSQTGGRVTLPLKALGKNLSLPLPSQQAFVLIDLSFYPSSLCLCYQSSSGFLPGMSESKPPSLIKTLVSGFGATLIQYDLLLTRLHL